MEFVVFRLGFGLRPVLVSVSFGLDSTGGILAGGRVGAAFVGVEVTLFGIDDFTVGGGLV